MVESNTLTTEDLEKDHESKATSQESKPFRYRRLPVGVYEVYIEGGGQVPEALSGSWTKAVFVEASIDAYLKERDRPKRSYRKSRGSKNAKRSNTAG